MDSSFLHDIIKLETFVVHGYIAFLSLKVVSALENSVDPGEMPHIWVLTG